MRDDFHPVVDEYLEAIGWLAEGGGPVIAVRIAEWMRKSRTSVSEMLERLEASGYVERFGREIHLTEEGLGRSQRVIRRHRLAECLLVEVIGLSWRDVHAEAGRFERVISDDVEERLSKLLGDPATCPHGNPIPGSASARPDAALQMRLTDTVPGQSVRLVRLTQEVEVDQASLAYLDEGGFAPGATALVLERGPDGTLVLGLGGGSLALGPELCARLFVVAA
ncbi:MAG TPA: metal-dependent transcriptional regulator [Acidimicrobiales bacterium]|nr:metal-dependent transcriptional regulator [Acidimicrobiales bacterium]